MKENWIIFDFGRTLYDPDIKNLFSESLDILNYLSSKGYNLGLTSLARHQSGQTKEERIQTIESFNLNSYFRFIYVTDDSKDALYEQACQKFDIKPENLTIVDDRTIRGISWGNKFGAKTVWLKKGKFKDEIPNKDTGEPTHTIENLLSLREVL